MSARMKMHHIESIDTPVLGAKETKSWRETFKEDIERFTEQRLTLKGLRAKEGMTQKQLAEILGIHTHHISEMENGRRPIGKAMAHRLAKALHVGYRIFL